MDWLQKEPVWICCCEVPLISISSYLVIVRFWQVRYDQRAQKDWAGHWKYYVTWLGWFYLFPISPLNHRISFRNVNTVSRNKIIQHQMTWDVTQYWPGSMQRSDPASSSAILSSIVNHRYITMKQIGTDANMVYVAHMGYIRRGLP